MYRVRHVERHGYRKTPRCNSPSVGDHNAACWNTQRRRVLTTWIVAKWNASPTSAGAHSRPDGSQWRVVLGTRRSVYDTQGSSKSVPQPRQQTRAGQNRGAAPKDTLVGRRGERAPGWVRASTRREDHTRPYQGPHTMCSAVLFRPGSGAGARPRTRNTNILCRARA